MHRLMGNTVRFILALSALLLSATSLFGQYGTFNADEREIKQYPVYDTYVDIIVEYNNGQTITEVIAELDSLAEKSLKASENLQYLFLKNEIANILSHRSEYVRAYNILKNSTEKFRTRHDTLHMEYYASLRLQRNLLNRIKNSPTHEVTETRSQEELFEAQFALLDTLGKTGEAYRHSLIDYGLMLFRKGKTKKAIESMYKTRYMALEADDLTSLALADYSIITNMPVSYDLLQTQQEVLKADIGLFE